MIQKVARGKEVGKGERDVWQTRHIQCRNKMVNLIPVAQHHLVEGFLVQLWTDMMKIPIFDGVRSFEELDFVDQPVNLLACECAYQPFDQYLIGG